MDKQSWTIYQNGARIWWTDNKSYWDYLNAHFHFSLIQKDLLGGCEHWDCIGIKKNHKRIITE